MTDNLEVTSLRQPITDIMWECGDILINNFGTSLDVEYKNNQKSDPVTEIDKQLQTKIIKALSQIVPKHNVLGEEEEQESYNQQASDYLWIIDPLDGTVNYIKGIKFCAISIALRFKSDVILGVVFKLLITLVIILVFRIPGSVTIKGLEIIKSSHAF